MARVHSPVLTTPNAITHGLGLLGITWNPRLYDADEQSPDAGMYAWVDGKSDYAPLDAGVLYIGVGEDSVRGAAKRIEYETSAHTDEYIHGHAYMGVRRSALCVWGTVERGSPTLLPEIGDDDWWRPLIGEALDWLALGGDRTLVRKAEAIAIRLAIHIGDVGAPVNSALGSAWRVDQHWEVLAYTAARVMAARFPGRCFRGVAP